MSSFYSYDKILKAHKPFQRFASFAAAGINLSDAKFNPDESLAKLTKSFETDIRKLMAPSFKVPQLTRSAMGNIVNVDEAYEGIAECYRHVREIKLVLKIGLNVSADVAAKNDIYALRCAAVIALWNLAKQRGQNVQFDVCYGVGKSWAASEQCHLRVTLQNPTPNIIARIMTANCRVALADKVYNIPGSGKEYGTHYRLHEWTKFFGKPEFDFALDRIETSDYNVERQRILNQIKHLK